MAVEVYMNGGKLGSLSQEKRLKTSIPNRENISLTAYASSDDSIRFQTNGNFTPDSINNWKRAVVEAEIKNQFHALKSKYIWTINGIEPNDGKFAIIGRGALSVGAGNNYSSMLRSTRSPKSSEPAAVIDMDSVLELFKTAPAEYLMKNLTDYLKSLIEDKACADLVKYQMALYHYINDMLSRLLSDEPPYGLFYNYMAAKCYWNVHVFKESLAISVDSLKDGVYMDTYYKNDTANDVQLTVVFEITNLTDFVDVEGDDLPSPEIYVPPVLPGQEGPDYDLDKDWGSAGWLAIYLNQSNALLDTGIYQVKRKENINDKDGVDITDINNCKWERTGFAAGEIQQQVIVPRDKILHTVFAIAKNPNINGFTTYGSLCEFSIKAKAYFKEIENSEVNGDNSSTDGFADFGELVLEREFSAHCCKLIRGSDLAYTEEADDDIVGGE